MIKLDGDKIEEIENFSVIPGYNTIPIVKPIIANNIDNKYIFGEKIKLCNFRND